MKKWRRIDDPPVIERGEWESDKVLLVFSDGDMLVGRYRFCTTESHTLWVDGEESLRLMQMPTHWMPLPEAP